MNCIGIRASFDDDRFSDLAMNPRRADWARTAVLAFAAQTGQTSEAECLEDVDCFNEVVGDLIGNLGHLADTYGHDVEVCVWRGRGYFEEETAAAAEEAREEQTAALDEVVTALSALTGHANELGRRVAEDPALACVAETAAELDEAVSVLKEAADLVAQVDPSLRKVASGAGELADAVAVIKAATSPTREAAAG